jgi:hypothetical protein
MSGWVAKSGMGRAADSRRNAGVLKPQRLECSQPRVLGQKAEVDAKRRGPYPSRKKGRMSLDKKFIINSTVKRMVSVRSIA